MVMDSRRRLSIALLITAVVLSGGTNEIEVQSDTCVWVGVEVNFHSGRNSSGEWCEAPGQPLNGGYRSESDDDGHRYSPGDIITYYCKRGHELIGQANRTCNGTPNGWQPDEPYCQPEYISHLMRRLSGIEDQMERLSDIEGQMRVIEQRITTIENNTSKIGYNISLVDKRMSTIDNKVTAIDSRVSVLNNTMAAMNNKVSSMENNVSAIYNMELLTLQIDRKRLAACTDITKTIDQDTLTKCKTMQMGVRNGRSVSVFTWVIDDYSNKVANQRGDHYSQPFYHTVPGYKFNLKGYIYANGDIYIYLQLLPGEYDDKLKWPFSIEHDVTVLANTDLEVLHRTFSGEQSTCHLNRPTSPTDYICSSADSNWAYVWENKKQILSDGSVVVKLYFYN